MIFIIATQLHNVFLLIIYLFIVIGLAINYAYLGCCQYSGKVLPMWWQRCATPLAQNEKQSFSYLYHTTCLSV